MIDRRVLQADGEFKVRIEASKAPPGLQLSIFQEGPPGALHLYRLVG
jgi:hypothetical protein